MVRVTRQDDQRRNKTRLSDDRTQKLEAAGFVWSVRAKSHTWEEMFIVWSQAAKKGSVGSRHVEVIDNIKYNVGNWQDKQRRNRTRLSDDMKQKLEAAGFVWSALGHQTHTK
jgi:gas vesicle protein